MPDMKTIYMFKKFGEIILFRFYLLQEEDQNFYEFLFFMYYKNVKYCSTSNVLAYKTFKAVGSILHT